MRETEMIMGAHTVMPHALEQGAPSAADVRVNLVTMPGNDRRTIELFLIMLDRGTGGASGLRASTRLEAKSGLAHMIARDPRGAVAVAETIGMGARSQGEAISDLITFRRNLPPSV